MRRKWCKGYHRSSYLVKYVINVALENKQEAHTRMEFQLKKLGSLKLFTIMFMEHLMSNHWEVTTTLRHS